MLLLILTAGFALLAIAVAALLKSKDPQRRRSSVGAKIRLAKILAMALVGWLYVMFNLKRNIAQIDGTETAPGFWERSVRYLQSLF